MEEKNKGQENRKINFKAIYAVYSGEDLDYLKDRLELLRRHCVIKEGYCSDETNENSLESKIMGGQSNDVGDVCLEIKTDRVIAFEYFSRAVDQKENEIPIDLNVKSCGQGSDFIIINEQTETRKVVTQYSIFYKSS